jgi:putative SOS response-associated peptidase YedK
MTPFDGSVLSTRAGADAEGNVDDIIAAMFARYRLSGFDALAAAMGVAAACEPFSREPMTRPLEFGPGQYVPIIRLAGQNRMFDLAYWGFIPSWAAGDARIKPIHARSETVAVSGMFRSAFMSSRCLVPADGFYEPQGRRLAQSPPRRFVQRSDGRHFAFAAIWSYRDDCQTCAVLTKKSSDPAGSMRRRMPIILSPDDYGRWLNPSSGEEDLQELLQATTAVELVVPT